MGAANTTLNRKQEMPRTHGCIWIDHREAKIFGIDTTGSNEMVVHNHHAPKHIHRKADQIHEGKLPPDHPFFDQIAGALGAFKAILVVGPGTTRSELVGYLSEHYPMISKRIWGIEAVDHPTEPQIIAAAQKYFNAANRMHA